MGGRIDEISAAIGRLTALAEEAERRRQMICQKIDALTEKLDAHIDREEKFLPRIDAVETIAKGAKAGADDWLRTKTKFKYGAIGAGLTGGAGGGVSVAAFVAWLKGMF